MGNKRKIEPKELPCSSVPLLLIADAQQLEILVTALALLQENCRLPSEQNL